REAQLVDDPTSEQRAEEARPALAMQLREAALDESLLQQHRVDGCLAAVDHVGDGLEGGPPLGWGLRTREDDRPIHGAREERAGRIELEAARHDRELRMLGEPFLDAPRPPL